MHLPVTSARVITKGHMVASATEGLEKLKLLPTAGGNVQQLSPIVRFGQALFQG